LTPGRLGGEDQRRALAEIGAVAPIANDYSKWNYHSTTLLSHFTSLRNSSKLRGDSGYAIKFVTPDRAVNVLLDKPFV
jgi:hypothetical protein